MKWAGRCACHYVCVCVVPSQVVGSAGVQRRDVLRGGGGAHRDARREAVALRDAEDAAQLPSLRRRLLDHGRGSVRHPDRGECVRGARLLLLGLKLRVLFRGFSVWKKHWPRTVLLRQATTIGAWVVGRHVHVWIDMFRTAIRGLKRSRQEIDQMHATSPCMVGRLLSSPMKIFAFFPTGGGR